MISTAHLQHPKLSESGRFVVGDSVIDSVAHRPQPNLHERWILPDLEKSPRSRRSAMSMAHGTTQDGCIFRQPESPVLMLVLDTQTRQQQESSSKSPGVFVTATSSTSSL